MNDLGEEKGGGGLFLREILCLPSVNCFITQL